VLTAESAATLFDRDAAAARGQVERLQDLAREALDELRSLVLELRAPDLERDGLCGALRKHAELQQRLYGVPIELQIDDSVSIGEADREVLRIAQEALHNAVRHAGASRITIRLDDSYVLEVADNGSGFDPSDPELRSRHLGLTSMEERARRLGGSLKIDSGEQGTTVRLEVSGG
jgi:signal transduction histidine kinase